MKQRRIRVVTICLFARGDQILVAEGFDAAKGSAFYRPLGGVVEFGETTRAALVREMKEELGQEVKGLRLVGTLENLFELGCARARNRLRLRRRVR